MSDKGHIPTEEVAKNAAKGLSLRKEFGHGGTLVGANMAKKLSEKKSISSIDIKRMVSYFARHEVDKQAADFNNKEKPSKGYIAWCLWGGDAGKKWAEKTEQTLKED